MYCMIKLSPYLTPWYLFYRYYADDISHWELTLSGEQHCITGIQSWTSEGARINCNSTHCTTCISSTCSLVNVTVTSQGPGKCSHTVRITAGRTTGVMEWDFLGFSEIVLIGHPLDPDTTGVICQGGILRPCLFYLTWINQYWRLI